MGKKIIVIGSGLAGTLICNELAVDCEVTLLEKGHKDAIEYPAVDFVGKHFGAVKTFCIGEGGTTNIWDNGLIPINPEDVSSIPFARIVRDARQYIDKAAVNLYFAQKRYSTEYQSVLSEMTDVANGFGMFSDGVDCLLYPKSHKRLYVSSKVNRVYDVEDINFAVENGRVKAVHYSAGGRQFRADPDAVILCAGAMGTPLLIKKVLSAAGSASDLVGKGLADHPMGFVGKIKVQKRYQKQIQQMAYSDRGYYICRTAVRLKSECGRYTCCAFFRPALTMGNSLSIYKYKSLLGASKGAERIRNVFSPKLFHPDILAEIYSHLFGVQLKSRIFNVMMIFEQKRGNSRVYYDDAGIKVDWRLTDEEMAAYNNILEKLKGMLLPFSEKLAIQIPVTSDWLWSAAHHSGTISVGSLPEGVVDENLNLHGCGNVYACDGSVIQEHSYANTGLTIGAVAMRLADLLKRNVV